jgi:triosephosphate isomerase
MSDRARRPVLAGNWKMHLRRAEAADYAVALRAGLPAEPPAEVVLFPSFLSIPTLAEALAGAPVEVGGQDLHAQPEGAHTGDVSAAQLLDAGCRWVLCGHSERRRDHGETDARVIAKARAALAAGLRPIVCVGESRDERRAGQTFDVLDRQVAELPEDSGLLLAYEPVWAIGTGETATPEVAADAHRFLRERLGRRLGEPYACRLRILYGGSVTPDNASELAARADIDGFLVGGASLDPRRFLAILGAFAPSGADSRGTP